MPKAPTSGVHGTAGADIEANADDWALDQGLQPNCGNDHANKEHNANPKLDPDTIALLDRAEAYLASGDTESAP